MLMIMRAQELMLASSASSRKRMRTERRRRRLRSCRRLRREIRTSGSALVLRLERHAGFPSQRLTPSVSCLLLLSPLPPSPFS